MFSLNRDKVQRMVGTSRGGSGGGGSFSAGDLAGYASQLWVQENFLSIEFFSNIFKTYGPGENEGDPDVEVIPNDTESTISNIKAMFGFWTEQYVSALGQNDAGGGGGGISLNEPLSSINTSGLAAPGAAQNGMTLIWNNSAQKWTYGTTGGGGSVTSVGLDMPTGFSVTNSPVTSSGIFEVSFALGYSLPLTADVAKGVSAYGWGNHAEAGYALASNVYSKTEADARFLTISFFRSLFKAYAGSTEIVPNDGAVGTIDNIKAMFGFWTNQYISALGQSSGGGGGVSLNEPLSSINTSGLAAPGASQNGMTLIWNNSAQKWTYGTTGGSGSVTSVGLSMPTGFSVANTPVTSSGIFSVTFSTGYSLPLAADVEKGVSAYNSLSNYLPLSGGTLIGSNNFLSLKSTTANNWIYFYTTENNTEKIKAAVGYYEGLSFISNETTYARIGVNDAGTPQYWSNANPGNAYTLWHSGNFTPSNYLPLSGGTMTGNIVLNGNPIHFIKSGSTFAILCWNATYNKYGIWYKDDNVDKMMLSASGNADTPAGADLCINGNGDGTVTIRGNSIWHSGNFSPSNYLPLTGGTLTGNLTAPTFIGNLQGNADTATTASKLSTVSKTAWGQTYWTSGGVPDSISGNMSSVGDISFSASGKNIGGLIYFDTTNSRVGVGTSSPSYLLDVNGYAKATRFYLASGVYLEYDSTNAAVQVVGAGLYTNSYISALGVSSGGGSGSGVSLNQPLSGINNAGLSAPATSGQAIVYNGTNWTYSGSTTLNANRISAYTGSFGSSLDVAAQLTIAAGDLVVTNGRAGIGGSVSSTYKLYVHGAGRFTDLAVGTTSTVLSTVTCATIETLNSRGLYLKTASGLSVYANAPYSNQSDIRTKNIVSEVEGSVDDIANAPIFNFEWKNEEVPNVLLGSSAQYWKDILPHAVTTAPNGYLSMDYSAIALAAAVVTARKVVDHEKRIAALERENEELRAEIVNLKAH